MSISKIKKDLEGQKKFPPVDQWNPDLCEGQEFFIDREGNWFYNNSMIKNKKLINLFSTVIRNDDDRYFLVTPVEKVPVKVELAPYKVIDFVISKNNIKLVTNMNYEFILNEFNTTRLIIYNNSEIPLVHVRNKIEGFFDRNIYYKFVDLALENNYIENKSLFIPSNNHKHIIGNVA